MLLLSIDEDFELINFIQFKIIGNLNSLESKIIFQSDLVYLSFSLE
jgi:hypothetical protein